MLWKIFASIDSYYSNISEYWGEWCWICSSRSTKVESWPVQPERCRSNEDCQEGTNKLSCKHRSGTGQGLQNKSRWQTRATRRLSNSGDGAPSNHYFWQQGRTGSIYLFLVATALMIWEMKLYDIIRMALEEFSQPKGHVQKSKLTRCPVLKSCIRSEHMPTMVCITVQTASPPTMPPLLPPQAAKMTMHSLPTQDSLSRLFSIPKFHDCSPFQRAKVQFLFIGCCSLTI